MTDQFSVVDFTTGAGTLDITSAAITQTCKAAVLIYSAVTTEDSAQAHAVSGIGLVADDGHTDEVTTAMAVRSTDALTTTQVSRTVKFSGSATKVVIGTPRRSAAGTDTFIDLQFEYNSFISGGLRLNAITTTDTTKGGALLIAGVSRAYVGTFIATTTLAHENVGGAGNLFQADLIIFIGHDGAFAGGGSFSLQGIADLSFALRNPSGTTSQIGAIMGWNNGADPADADGRLSTTEIASFDTSRAYQGITIAIDSTGFNHQLTTGAASPDMGYLAIQFSEAHRIAIQHLTAPSGTGNATFSPGFAPSLVFGFSSLMTSTNADIDGATATSFGRFMFTSAQSRAVSCSSGPEGSTITAGTPTVTRTIQGDHAVQTLAGDGTVAQQASYVGLTDTGFTLNFSTATAGTLTALMIGPSVANETVGITESSTEVISAFQANETVGITESSTEVISAFQANETVGILEGVGVVFDVALGEIVGILDSDILTATSIERTTADRRGGTTESIALRGSTFEHGAELGQSLG